jgi:hypothetical protein
MYTHGNTDTHTHMHSLSVYALDWPMAQVSTPCVSLRLARRLCLSVCAYMCARVHYVWVWVWVWVCTLVIVCV